MEDFCSPFSLLYVNKHFTKHKSQTFNLQKQESSTSKFYKKTKKLITTFWFYFLK